MTIDELRRYGGLKRHINVLQEQLDMIGTSTVGAVAYDGMPHGSTPGDPVGMLGMRIAIISQEIAKSQKEADIECVKILEFLQTIQADDSIPCDERDFVYDILHYRFLELLSWDEIGAKCNMDRRTASRKAYNYIDKRNKLPTMPGAPVV